MLIMLKNDKRILFNPPSANDIYYTYITPVSLHSANYVQVYSPNKLYG